MQFFNDYQRKIVKCQAHLSNVMSEYEEKIRKYIKINNIQAKLLTFDQSTHSVAEAAAAVKAQPEDFVKSICMIGPNEALIVAIVKGEHRASTRRVAKALNIARPRLANPVEMRQKSGYPAGGTPAFGYNAMFLMDPKVLDKEFVYSGGGSENALILMSPKEMKKANGAKIVRIRS
jgi:prolyl-tRNA editing enzyme YbaK/EbsC (Cys-tRNA(Pro) deacylase)